VEDGDELRYQSNNTDKNGEVTIYVNISGPSDASTTSSSNGYSPKLQFYNGTQKWNKVQ